MVVIPERRPRARATDTTAVAHPNYGPALCVLWVTVREEMVRASGAVVQFFPLLESVP